MEKEKDSETLLALTTEIVSSYVSNNTVDASNLTCLIQQIYSTLSGIDGNCASVGPRREPAVPVKKSVTPDYIVCLEDGKQLKMLKRHLKTVYNMTPEQYRDRWNLPMDYPMVAPNYAVRRSQLAKDIGLGVRGRPRKTNRMNGNSQSAGEMTN